MTKLINKLRDVVFEHDGSNPAILVQHAPQIPQPVFDLAAQHAQVMEVASGASVEDLGLYDHLCQVTDPAKFPAFQTFQIMCRKLEAAIPDRLTRMKAAIATSDVTAVALVASVQTMKQALKADIEASHQKLDALAQSTSADVTRLQKELADATRHAALVDQTRSALTSANARRSAELDQMEKELASLR